MSARREPGRRTKVREIRERIKHARQQRSLLSRETEAARLRGKDSGYLEHLKKLKGVKQELFQLEQQLRATREENGAEEREIGALPDFSIIGAAKCGTTFLYHLLAKHPLVDPAAFKEPHFFDLQFDRGVEWYRRCFPAPRSRDGIRMLTGEATPGYLSNPEVPERMAGVVPNVKLIALLRDPVDKLFSAYHFFGSRKGMSVLEFDEYANAALEDPAARKLSKGVYVDQLLCWSHHFEREQMLVLKSEDFFVAPRETVATVLRFLDLPAWQPDDSDLDEKRNKGAYRKGMAPETRRRLKEFYEPHNQRLYEYLGVDFGW